MSAEHSSSNRAPAPAVGEERTAGDPTSRLWKQHHVDKAQRALQHASEVLRVYDVELDTLRPTIGLDLLDALEHVALAAGWYVPGIGMERRSDLKDVTL